MEKVLFKDGVYLSRLGMGNMRLPFVPGTEDIDYEKSQEIIDYAMTHGINYYDTAYVYNNGESERFLGVAMKKYPRDSYYLATKWHMPANNDFKSVFEEQLKRLQTDHIDFYLIHCLTDGTVDGLLASGGIEYFLEQKKLGRIKYLGFSSHAGLAALRKFADHHKWDFAQLQINYYDWNYSETAEEYKILEERGIPCQVMEPVRGGRLAKLTDDAEALLHSVHPEWTIASWALRFVRSLSNTRVILSGMSNMEQIINNVDTFSDDYKFTPDDKKVLFEACEKFRKIIHIPCTACHYCTNDCPMQINIPEYLKYLNAYKTDGPWGLMGIENVKSEGHPSDCIACGSCASLCPQSIHIPDYMAELASVMEKMKK